MRWKFPPACVNKNQRKDLLSMTRYEIDIKDGLSLGDNANVIVKDVEKFSGRYVALRSFWDKTPICSGDDPVDVHKKAQSQGIKEPVIFFVPTDAIYIY